MTECKHCNGEGQVFECADNFDCEGDSCTNCDGSGYIDCSYCDGAGIEK